MPARNRAVGMLGLAVVAVLLAGCATPSSADSVTLTIGTDDDPGVPAADQIEQFAQQVTKLSKGQIRIKPVWHAAGDTLDWDQEVATMVMRGTLDLGNIPSRAWDSLGVTSLEPLTAPFLIQSTAALDQVVSKDFARRLLAGLPSVGVTGLALLPEGLRRPFGYSRALLGPDDYRGATLRVPTSTVSARMFASFGASVTDGDPNTRQQAGRESSFLLATPGAGIATGNVVFYPKVNVLVVNETTRNSLNPDQRQILARAAAAVLNSVIARQPDEVTEARDFCARGGTVVNASEQEVAALRDAAEPVIASIAAQPGNREMIDRIRDVASERPLLAVEACGGVTVPQPLADQSRIDGRYRFELKADALRRAGVADEAWIARNDGVYTWDVKGGLWTLTRGAAAFPSVVQGSYRLLPGDVVQFAWPDDPPETYTWRLDARGDLTLSTYEVPSLEAATRMTSQRWERIP